MAHAFYPSNDVRYETEVQLNNATIVWEKTMRNPKDGKVSFYQVLVHEIGHTLGLGLDMSRWSIM